MQAFDALMDMCRNKAMASGNACNPVIFEPMVMSILLAQQKEMQQLEYKLNGEIWQEICTQKNDPTASGKLKVTSRQTKLIRNLKSSDEIDEKTIHAIPRIRISPSVRA